MLGGWYGWFYAVGFQDSCVFTVRKSVSPKRWKSGVSKGAECEKEAEKCILNWLKRALMHGGMSYGTCSPGEGVKELSCVFVCSAQ